MNLRLKSSHSIKGIKKLPDIVCKCWMLNLEKIYYLPIKFSLQYKSASQG